MDQITRFASSLLVGGLLHQGVPLSEGFSTRFRALIGDRKGTTKKLCDKDFAERSGELSGAICLKTLVLLGNDPVTPRIVQKILWCCSCNFLALWLLFGC